MLACEADSLLLFQIRSTDLRITFFGQPPVRSLTAVRYPGYLCCFFLLKVSLWYGMECFGHHFGTPWWLRCKGYAAWGTPSLVPSPYPQRDLLSEGHGRWGCGCGCSDRSRVDRALSAIGMHQHLEFQARSGIRGTRRRHSKRTFLREANNVAGRQAHESQVAN